jgi:hypothetical protein
MAALAAVEGGLPTAAVVRLVVAALTSEAAPTAVAEPLVAAAEAATSPGPGLASTRSNSKATRTKRR